MYHTEIYVPIIGKQVAVIDFRYQSDQDIQATQEPPRDMYVAKSKIKGHRTTAAFVRNSRGTLFMVRKNFKNSMKRFL